MIFGKREGKQNVIDDIFHWLSYCGVNETAELTLFYTPRG
jgi:hypothetical protein